MKKKVVAAALVCSVLGSSHANEAQHYDEYGDNYQSAVQRPVQRLDRFRRYGGQRVNETNSRFSNQNQSDSNYVINDQTGQKMYLHEIRNSANGPAANQHSREALNYGVNSNVSRGSGGHQGGQRVASRPNYSNHDRQNTFESNEQAQWSQYDFTGNVAGESDARNRRSGDLTQGRFAAAQSHYEKLQNVQSQDARWKSSAMDSHQNVTQKDSSWNKPATRPQQNWNNTQIGDSREWNQQQVSHGSAQADREENYAMDNGGFWPTRAQQTRYSQQPSASFHSQTDELSSNPRRMHSRIDHSESQPQPQSEYQSLRRPRVRVDLTQTQKNRSKRQRRSWFPNPFRGVSRMFSGIFGRR